MITNKEANTPRAIVFYVLYYKVGMNPAKKNPARKPPKCPE